MQMIVPRNLNLHLEFLYNLPPVLRDPAGATEGGANTSRLYTIA